MIEYRYPTEYVSQLPVIFYNKDFTKAAVLVYSLMLNKKTLKIRLKTRLSAGQKYEIVDTDSNNKVEVKGNEFEVSLAPGQNSALFFIKAVDSK